MTDSMENNDSDLIDTDISSADESETNPLDGKVILKIRHVVWTLFDRFKEKNGKTKVKCLAKKSNGRLCSQILSGWYSNNAMRHLKGTHRKEYEEIRKKHDSIKSSTMKKSDIGKLDNQQTLLLSILSAKYSPQHPKQQEIKKKLAIAFIVNSLATRLIENYEFRELLAALDPKYGPPSRHLMKMEQESLFEVMKKNISNSLENANKIAITADIWTKRGGSESFIGATVHWFDAKSHNRRSVTLAIQKLIGSHTALSVYRNISNILELWNIPKSKISKVVTDNGTNMVKAFQDVFQLAMLNDEISDYAIEEDEIYETMEGDWRLEPEADDEMINKEITEFYEEEEALNIVFGSMGRLSCFAHTLQCAVRTLDKSTLACKSREKALDLMNSFAHSSKATQLLIEKTKKKLLTTCRTHWSYTCLALRRLLELKEAIRDIIDELGTIDNLSISEWKNIERYVNFMQPFADATYWIEGHKYATLSEIIPMLLELDHHLSQMENEVGFIHASKTLKCELNTRFGYIIDAKDEPVYAVATALDPRYRLVLNDQQLAAAKKEILKLLGLQAAPTSNSSMNHPAIEAESEMENSSRFKYVKALIQQRQMAREEEQTITDPVSQEVDLYFKEKHVLADSDDPLEFWNYHGGKYPQLSALASDILVIPATSAPVERLFSQTSIASGGKRNRLSGKQLECEVMLKTNKQFF